MSLRKVCPYLDPLFQILTLWLAGVEHVLIGMPHRGRLNLLTDLLKYPPRALFHKIKGNSEFPDWLGATGDVISHLCQYDCAIDETYVKSFVAIINALNTEHGELTVQLLQNPSHLGRQRNRFKHVTYLPLLQRL
jgi:probable 2-oxoglutarate dehydrogenase E1 component DHKTD1